jgi:hypothetical protein
MFESDFIYWGKHRGSIEGSNDISEKRASKIFGAF